MRNGVQKIDDMSIVFPSFLILECLVSEHEGSNVVGKELSGQMPTFCRVEGP